MINSRNFKRTEDLTKSEFIDAIKKINNAESVTGVKYSNIEVVNGTIYGIRESTSEPFRISVNALYNALMNVDEINVTTLKPFVNSVQSPALAILIAAHLVMPL